MSNSNLKIQYDNDEKKDISIDNLFSGENKSNIDFTRDEDGEDIIDDDLLFGFIANKDKMKDDSDNESVKQKSESDDDIKSNPFGFTLPPSHSSPIHTSPIHTSPIHTSPSPPRMRQSNFEETPDYEHRRESSRETSQKTRREKAFLLFQLKKLSEKGYNQSKDYTMDDNIDDVKDEVSRIKKEIEIEKSVKLARQGLTLITSLLETGNASFAGVTGVDLDGWSESINSNIEDYDEVFEELYEKYQESVSMSPEIKLLLMVAGSAVSFHLTKKMLGGGASGPNIMSQLSSTFTGGNSMDGPSSQGIEDILSKMKSKGNRTVSLSSDSGGEEDEVKIPLKKSKKKKSILDL
jgi:hypothetical protein